MRHELLSFSMQDLSGNGIVKQRYDDNVILVPSTYSVKLITLIFATHQHIPICRYPALKA